MGEAAVSLARSLALTLSLDGRYKGTDVVASRRGLLRQEIWIFLFYVRTTSLWSEKVKDKSFRPLLQNRAEIQNISFSFMCPAEIVTTVTTIYWAFPSLSLFLLFFFIHVCPQPHCSARICRA